MLLLGHVSLTGGGIAGPLLLLLLLAWGTPEGVPMSWRLLLVLLPAPLLLLLVSLGTSWKLVEAAEAAAAPEEEAATAGGVAGSSTAASSGCSFCC
jgi:hypothetical protein